MTPTNDAPVTVEQADAEVARLMAMSDDEIMREADAGDVAWARGFKLGLASGKSAALASAPAEPFGYWVEQKGAEPALLRKPAYIPEPSNLRTVTPLYTNPASAPAGDGDKAAHQFLFHAGVHESTDRAIGLIPYPIALRAVREALDRPRAAVGERDSALRQAAQEAYRVCAETRHVRLGDKARDAILALQSPPAKVEG